MTDYCRGDREHGADFKSYVKQRDYKFMTVKVGNLKCKVKCPSVTDSIYSSDRNIQILWRGLVLAMWLL